MTSVEQFEESERALESDPDLEVRFSRIANLHSLSALQELYSELEEAVLMAQSTLGQPLLETIEQEWQTLKDR